MTILKEFLEAVAPEMVREMLTWFEAHACKTCPVLAAKVGNDICPGCLRAAQADETYPEPHPAWAV